jgi:hypothetical protein
MLYALVANDCSFAVDVFTNRHLAEAALADALADEPQWSVLLAVIVVRPGRDEWLTATDGARAKRSSRTERTCSFSRGASLT